MRSMSVFLGSFLSAMACGTGQSPDGGNPPVQNTNRGATCTAPYVEQNHVCVLTPATDAGTRPPPDAGTRPGDAGNSPAPDAGSVPSACASRTAPGADNQAVSSAWTLTQLHGVAPDALGVLSTVVSGTQPVLLPVVFKGFFNEPGLAGLYLWFEGDPCDHRWEEYGGAVAGMSGSPVYIDGRLAGALSLSYGTRREGPFPFAVTPFESMHNVSADPGDVAGGEIPGGVEIGSSLDPGRTFSVLALGMGGLLTDAPTSLGDVRTLSAGGLVGSCGNTAGEAMSSACAIPGGLRAGSAIAVPVLFGARVNLAAIGTVTAVDGNRVWAFGHPFFANGPSALPFMGAEINAILGDPVFGSYKLGAPRGPVLGRINQDRYAAIAGRLGDLATVMRLRITVNGEGTHLDDSHFVPTALDPFSRDFYGITGAYYTLIQAEDYVWSDAVEAEVTIRFAGENQTVSASFAAGGGFDTAYDAAFGILFTLSDAETEHGSYDVVDVRVDVTRGGTGG